MKSLVQIWKKLSLIAILTVVLVSFGANILIANAAIANINVAEGGSSRSGSGTNKTLTVNASSKKIEKGKTCTFTASSKGTSGSYSWSRISGSSASIQSGTGRASVTIKGNSAGVSTFKVTIDGLSKTVTVTVTDKTISGSGSKTPSGSGIQIPSGSGSKTPSGSGIQIPSGSGIQPQKEPSLSTTNVNVRLGGSQTVSIQNPKESETYTWTVLSGSGSSGKISISNRYGTSTTINGLAVGKANISVYRDSKVMGTISVSVTSDGVKIPVATAVEFPVTQISMQKNSTRQISRNVYPQTAQNKDLIWESSDHSIAMVNNSGSVRTLNKDGIVTITAKTKNGVTASCVVKVGNASFSPSLSQSSIPELKPSVVYIIYVLGADGVEVTNVYSSNDNIINVQWTKGAKLFSVMSKKVGKATVYVELANGSRLSCLVTSVGQEDMQIAEDGEYIKPTGIRINGGSILIREGESIKLSATVTPSNATYKGIVWDCSDNYLSIDSQGNLKAIKYDKNHSYLIATAGVFTDPEGGSKENYIEDFINVQVVPKNYIEPKSIKINNASHIYLKEGESIQLSATIEPNNSTKNKIIWDCSDKYLRVTSNGKLTAVKYDPAHCDDLAVSAGIFTDPDGGSKEFYLEDIAYVTILPKNFVEPTSITLNTHKLTLIEGSTYQLSAVVGPEKATYDRIRWDCSDNYLRIDGNGRVTAIKCPENGSKVYAEAYIFTMPGAESKVYEISDSCEIEIVSKENYVRPSSVRITNGPLLLREGESIQLNAMILPSQAAYHEIEWSCSDTYLSISKSGYLKAEKYYKNAKNLRATARVYIESEDGTSRDYVEDSIIVQVVPKNYIAPTSVKIQGNKQIYLKEGQSVQLTAKVEPSNSSIKKALWGTSNDYLEVGESGRIKALKYDSNSNHFNVKAYINANPDSFANEDYIIEDIAYITILPKNYVKPTSIKLSSNKATLYEGMTYKLNATIGPKNATYETINWKSSSDCVSVDSEGNVTVLKYPTNGNKVKVTASVDTVPGLLSNQTVLEDSCEIEIKPGGNFVAPQSIKINNPTMMVKAGESIKLDVKVTPSNATYDIVWSCPKGMSISNDGVLRIDPFMRASDNGYVVKAGVYTSPDRTKDFYIEDKISVIVAPSNFVQPKSITINPNHFYLKEGENKQLKAEILPLFSADQKDVIWSSSNNNIKVSKNGKVTALKYDSENCNNIPITGGLYTDPGGIYDEFYIQDTCYVTILPKNYKFSSAMRLNGETKIRNGESTQLNVSYFPSDPTSKDIEWSASSDLVTVDNTGKVTAVREPNFSLGEKVRIEAKLYLYPDTKEEFISAIIDITVYPKY